MTSPRPRTPTARFVVLLRAVNVGGRPLDKATWERALRRAGCWTARTVGASGNAVVEVGPAVPAGRLEQLVADALVREAGLVTDAFVRDPEAWDRLVQGNPFLSEAENDPAHVVVTVLRSSPEPGAWDRLARSVQGRETVRAGERHAYIVYPDGIGRSKLTAAAIERGLGVRGTSRNWNTVLRLRELARA